MKSFKMICHSHKCAGAKGLYGGVVKSENKFLRDCPDCGHALFAKTRTNKMVKDYSEKTSVKRKGAELGFASRNRYE